ncbi:GNAT family N-acetyltransferase [Phytomonospora sp. NPDC050363]|uniref:GNAT family N-acetyltransferase n=1 Tax=Phytomonospora sp. NPDC050363 TaxID=3155642 RepID=UPI0034020766
MEQAEPWIADPVAVPVRRLTGDDREACMDLAVDREWGREEPKWRFLFEVAEVYGVDAPDGGLAGCYTLTRYGTESAAIGMVLVAARYNGRGLGRRMMNHALDIAGDALVSLYATEMGRPLYEKLGFEVVDVNTSHIGVFKGAAPGLSRPVTAGDLDTVLAYDRDAFGADRTRLLTVLHASAAAFRVVEADGKVTGYAAAWRNTHHLVIGPVVAEDLDTAGALIADLSAGAEAPVRVDVLHSRPALREWATANGIGPGFDGTFMVVGGAAVPGDPARVFAPVTQAV